MDNFLKFIDENIENLTKEEEILKTTDRKDESNLKKIQVNIYDIAKTYYMVVNKNTPANEFANAYVTKLENLYNTWEKAYASAKKYDDTQKVVIEELKLSALRNVIEKFKEN